MTKDRFEQDRATLDYWFQLDEGTKDEIIEKTLFHGKIITYFDIERHCKEINANIDATRYLREGLLEAYKASILHKFSKP